jgi:glycosyltransferase involved in cell wall biosynthesis
MILSAVEALNRLPNVQAEIASTDADGPRRRLSPGDLSKDAPIHLFSRTWPEQWKLSLGMWKWLKENVRGYDVVHVHALWNFAAVAAARASDRVDVPYAVCPHGTLSPYTWTRGWLKKRVYWHALESRTVHRACCFHVTSEPEAAEVRALRTGARTFVIPNGVEAAAFDEPKRPDILRERCGAAAGQLPILLFLSRLHPKKGIVDRLLPAVATAQTSCFLAMVGAEDARAPGYEAEIRKAIDRLGLTSRVAMLGPVFGNERWALYDGAAAFVLPSHAENFGIVVAEAMARACPVIVTPEVQAADIVRQANSGMVVAGESAEFADAINSLLSDEHQRMAAGERGCQFAREQLQWTRIVEQMVRMYHGILAKR